VSRLIAAWLHHQGPEPARARSNNAYRRCCPAWAEEERTRILRLANEGRIAAIKRGTKLGRRPKPDDHQQREAINRLKAGESCRAIAKTYRVPHATVGRLRGGA
jgi:hypothetical protein